MNKLKLERVMGKIEVGVLSQKEMDNTYKEIITIIKSEMKSKLYHTDKMIRVGINNKK